MNDLLNISEECEPESGLGSTSDFVLGKLQELVSTPCHEEHRIPGAWKEDDRRFGEPETIRQQLSVNVAHMSFFLATYAHSTSGEFPGLHVFGDESNLRSPTISEELMGDLRLPPSFRPDFWNIRRYTAYVMGVSLNKSNVSSFSERLTFVPVSVSAEAISEANQQDLTDDLETAVALLNATFPTLHAIDVTIHHDPEILGRWTISFALTVSGKAEAILDCERLFKERLFSKIDIDVRPLLTFTYRFLE